MPSSSASRDLVLNNLLYNSQLDEQHLSKTLSSVLKNKIDFADLYFQSAELESWMLEDGLVKEGVSSVDRGVGVRACAGEKTGFAYSDEIVLPALTQAAEAARAITRSGGKNGLQAWNTGSIAALYSDNNPLQGFSAEKKIEMLRRADELARQRDKRVNQVIANIAGVYEQILVVATDGTFATDIRPLVRMNIQVVAEQDGRRETGSAGGGGRYNFNYFLQPSADGKSDNIEYFVNMAVDQAIVNLDAREAPAGATTVVLGSGWPGILLHEAIGHGLEGDFNRKGSSAFSGRIGEQVASEVCTVVDDGTIQDRRGSLSIDDEGVPGQNTVLIENGILKGYMQDKLNARLMDTESTGNGRRESYAHLTMPRMTNTYMLAGQCSPEDIISSVEDGIYASNFGGGQVDITSGKFVFSASEAYKIEKGEITYPVKGATLIGDGPEVLHQVSMVGNDLALDTGVGTCGKDGQSVPVGVGQPTLKIDQLTVGGTQ